LLFSLINGKNIHIITDTSNLITPTHLIGIQRRIAYANKKYHSGLICLGVTITFDIIQLSLSIHIKGFKKVYTNNNKKISKKEIKSFKK